MKSIIDINNPLFQFLLTLKDFVLLNLAWLLCCLPIVTIGASTSALFSVTLKAAENKESYVLRQFFKAFKQNFKQSTIAFFLLIIPILVLSFAISFWLSFKSIVGTIVCVLCGIFIVLLISMLIYIFPLIARYENSLKQTFRNAVYFSVMYKKYTIASIVIICLSIFLFAASGTTAILMSFFGFSYFAYVISYMMLKIFKQYEPDES